MTLPQFRRFLTRLYASVVGHNDFEHAAEFQEHLDLLTQRFVRQGLTPEEAARAARLQFGNITVHHEERRHMQTLPALEWAARDCRHAIRVLRRDPIFTAMVVLMLALGIGANTGIFSVLNSLLLKPLPVQRPYELVAVTDGGQNPYFALSYRVWKEIRDRRVFAAAFAWTTDRVNVSDTADNQFASAVWATGDVFDVLGVRALIGRTFNHADDQPQGGNAGPVAVISYRFWRAYFNGAADVIGRTLSVERHSFTIVGVMPPTFFGMNVGDTFDIMAPIEAQRLLGRVPNCLDSAACTSLQVIGRRAPEQTAAMLTTVLAAAQPVIREATMPPYSHAEDRARYFATSWRVEDAPGGFSRFRRQYAPALVTLLWVVGLVLLIACANIATLLLGRSAARRFEFGVRLALGASRATIGRQLLVESLLLSAIGALCGLVLAYWGSRLLVAQLSTWYSIAFFDLSFDWRVLLVTAAATVATGILFGILPGYAAMRVSPLEAVRWNPRLGSGSSGGRRLGGVLLVVQVALSLVLVIGGELFLRSFVALAYRDLGFDRHRVLVGVVDVRRSAIPPPERAALYGRMLTAVSSIPGVESAALSLATPLGNAGIRFTPDVSVAGNSAMKERTARILTTPVSPRWFRTYGTSLLAGRDFDEKDRVGTPPVAIVNEAFVRAYLVGGPTIGRLLVETISPAERRSLEIIGLVEDAAFATVRDRIEPTIYKPLAQRLDARLLTAIPTISVSVRAAAGMPPARLAGPLATALAEVDHDLAVTSQSVDDQLHPFYIRERLLAMLSGFFGGLALLLAAAGLYGATAYSVQQRRGEMSVRLALGAPYASIVTLVLRRVAVVVILGVMVGILAGVYAGRYVGALVYDTQPGDPWMVAGAAATLVVVAIVAGWLPARDAARTDPFPVLRQS